MASSLDLFPWRTVAFEAHRPLLLASPEKVESVGREASNHYQKTLFLHLAQRYSRGRRDAAAMAERRSRMTWATRSGASLDLRTHTDRQPTLNSVYDPFRVSIFRSAVDPPWENITSGFRLESSKPATPFKGSGGGAVEKAKPRNICKMFGASGVPSIHT